MKAGLALFAALMMSHAPLGAQESIRFVPGSAEQMKVVAAALAHLGTPYRYAGVSESGVDCSGLVYRVFADVAARQLPRTVGALFESGTAVNDDLQPGDLLFFDTTGGPSHVGIFDGSGGIIHSASAGPRTGVILSSLGENYYRSRYLGARRILPSSFPVLVVDLVSGDRMHTLDRVLPPGQTLVLELVSVSARERQWQLDALRGDEVRLTQRLTIVSGAVSKVLLPLTQGRWLVRLKPIDGEGTTEIIITVEEVDG